MKKILPALVIISFLAVMLLPMVSSAQKPPQECCKLKRALTLDGTTCATDSIVGEVVGACPGNSALNITCGTSAWGMFCLLNTIYNVIDWIFIILVAVVGLFVIMGAVTILTAAGAPEKITKGRDYILYAAIGLVVALLAKAIPGIVRLIAGF